jgi:two-component system cell cycle response regulator
MNTGDDNITYSDVDSQMGDFTRTVEMNERLLQQQLQTYELMLLDAQSLAALLDVLLITTRDHFGLAAANLTLWDAENGIAELLPDDVDYGEDLKLVRDSFDMQQLYGATPQIEVIDVTDHSTNGVFDAGEEDVEKMLLLPLIRDGHVVGSFHWGLSEKPTFASTLELELVGHLAAIVGICIENCVNAERLSQLSLLDPVTRLSNARAFSSELRKEISRAGRSQKTLTLLLMNVDDYKNITDSYGHLSSDHLLKTIGRQLSGMLRHTDYLARLGIDQYGILLPACSEAKGQEIAERMRSEIEFMEIDDGRGANLFASLSMAVTAWDPKNYPAVNMEQLASQLQNTAGQALKRAVDGGGNRVLVSRLTTLIV